MDKGPFLLRNGPLQYNYRKKEPRNRSSEALAAGEGFEPSHTESESAVLPLHKPAMFCLPQRTKFIIQENDRMSIVFSEIFLFFQRTLLEGVNAHRQSGKREDCR